MKKITFLILSALMLSTFSWHLNAQTYSGAGTPTPIPATGTGGFPCTGGPTVSTANVPLTGVIGTAPGEYQITSLAFNIVHTWASDIDLALLTPGGSTLDITSDNGGSSGFDTAATLIIRDDAPTAVNTWSSGAPSANGYRAEAGLLNTLLAGQTVNGNWTINICDDTGGDSGTLNSYQITFVMNPVTVGDPPVIVCPSDITANNIPGTCGAVANYSALAIDTEDGNISGDIVSTHPSGSTFPVGVTTVTLSVTDSDGNTSTCDFTVTVLDNEAPMAVCQDITVDLDPVTGMAVITAADVDNGSTDNCGIASMSLDVSSFDCSMTGANTVTLTVTDNSGNSTTCTSTVTVQDVTAPEVFCVGGFGIFTESEDFEGANIPTGWTTVIEAGARDWQFGSGDMPIGPDFSSNAAIFNDDAAGSGQTNLVRLLSPVYDLTGASNVTVGYDAAFREFGNQEFIVEVYDGSAWQQIALYDENLTAILTESFDVSAYVNASFQVRYTFDDLGGWGWGAGVDNFLLTYEAAAGGGLDVFLDANGMASISPNDLVTGVNEACGYTISAAGTGGGSMETLTTTFAGGNGLDGAM
ncbi:HYR domain-containing protein, partial [Aequorivita vladivostokensis]